MRPAGAFGISIAPNFIGLFESLRIVTDTSFFDSI